MLQYHINKLTVYHKQIEKFKTLKVSLVFEEPFEGLNLYARRMLTHILSTSSHKYHGVAGILKHCVELYNLNINFFHVKVGLNYLTTLDISLLAPKYIPDKKYLSKALNFCWELLLNPLIENGSFGNIQFDDAYRQLFHSIQVIKSNKARLSELKFEKILFKDQPQSLDNVVDEKILNEVTPADLVESYQKLLASSAYLIITGDVLPQEITKVLKGKLPFRTNPLTIPYVDKSIYEIKNEHIVEKVATNQSLLLVGYRVPIYKYDQQYFAMRLLNAMLGEYFHSSLMRVIREELGLAYAVSSVYFARLGALVINAGISSAKGDVTINAISKIIADYQAGRVDDDIFIKSKTSLMASLSIAEDSLYEYFIEGIDTRGNPEQTLSINQMIEIVDKLTLNDVIEVANALKLDTTYFMKGE